jgi:hypothetical protein
MWNLFACNRNILIAKCICTSKKERKVAAKYADSTKVRQGNLQRVGIVESFFAKLAPLGQKKKGCLLKQKITTQERKHETANAVLPLRVRTLEAPKP